jgi:hypothetical protein
MSHRHSCAISSELNGSNADPSFSCRCDHDLSCAAPQKNRRLTGQTVNRLQKYGVFQYMILLSRTCEQEQLCAGPGGRAYTYWKKMQARAMSRLGVPVYFTGREHMVALGIGLSFSCMEVFMNDESGCIAETNL